LNQILTTDLVPLRERGKFLGLISMMWSIGAGLGPLVGGVLSQKLSWRCIPFVNVPPCTSAFIGVIVFLRLRKKAASLVEMLKQVDWLGTLISMGAIPALLMPITWGGIMYPWNHPSTVVPMVVGVLGVVGFICYEKYVPSNPMIRLAVFTNRTSAVNYLGTMLHGMIVRLPSQPSIVYYWR
jgi:MFS family permease